MIYLDYAATAPLKPEVLTYIEKTLREGFGNPSALYDLGIASEKIIEGSRKLIAKSLQGAEEEIVFTSGGSESNNFALRGIAEAYKNRGKHLICSAVEHPSVLKTMAYLERCGFEVTRIGVDQRGNLDLNALKKALRKDTILCAVMMVNNEIGTLFPLGEIAEMIREKSPACFFHVDGVQGYGRLPVEPKKLGIDTFALSGHKFGAAKGSGALYIRDGVRVLPLIYGGGQERGLRAGTENFAYIGALGLGAKLSLQERDAKNRHLREVKQALLDALSEEGVAFKINGDPEKGVPYILNLSFPGIKSEVLLHDLEGQGIYVSQGSACHSRGNRDSETLTAMGYGAAERDTALRFSFGDETACSDMAAVAAAVKRGCAMIQKMRGKK